jgi:ATP-binding cassette subfamily E protein 1
LKCPFEAIDIINLPKSLAKDTTHRYGPNSFKLHRLPMPRPGHVLGLVGTNGIGKSTALMILAGKLKPNLGRFDNPPDWQEILVNFRGSELQNFFTKLLEDNIKAIIKPQYVDSIPRSVKGKVNEIIDRKNERKVKEELCDLLDLANVMERDIAQLSGGELQRFAIAVTCMQVSGDGQRNAVYRGGRLPHALDSHRHSSCRVELFFVLCRKRTCTCSMSLRPIWMCCNA